MNFPISMSSRVRKLRSAFEGGKKLSDPYQVAFHTPRKYQVKAYSSVMKEWETEKEVVLSMCASGGKTETALRLAYFNYLQKGQKVVVLAHSTNFLLSQWEQDIVGCGLQEYIESGQLVVLIPQSFKGKEKKEALAKSKLPVGLIIVDEAHEWYHAKTVQSILKHVKHNKALLLTGTPAKFIYENKLEGNHPKPIIVIGGCDIYQEGIEANDPYLQNLNIITVVGSYNLRGEDYTHSGNEEGIVRSTYKFSKEDTNNSLHTLMQAMVSRLKRYPMKSNSEVCNVINFVADHYAKPIKTLQSQGKMEKTIVFCRSIAQSEDVYEYLSKEFKCVLSDSESDPKSINIERFKNIDGREIPSQKLSKEDADIQILIVVDRANLGFNMTELVNIVDMTGCRNPSRLLQIYARGMRVATGINKGKDKFYFKLLSPINQPFDCFCMSVAIHLLDGEFCKIYDGRNINQYEVLLPKSEDKEEKDDDKEEKERKPRLNGEEREIKIPLDSDLFNRVTDLNILTMSRFNPSSKDLQDYSYTTIGDAVRALGMGTKDSDGWKQKLLQYGSSKHPGQRVTSKDPWYTNWCHYVISSNTATFDPEFKAAYEAKYPAIDKVSLTKKRIMESETALTPADEDYRKNIKYCDPNNTCLYDPEHAEAYEKKHGIVRKTQRTKEETTALKAEILNGTERIKCNDPLYKVVSNWCEKGNTSEDSEFRAAYYTKFGIKTQRTKEETTALKAEILNGTERIKKDNPLFYAIQNYLFNDPEFKAAYMAKFPPRNRKKAE